MADEKMKCFHIEGSKSFAKGSITSCRGECSREVATAGKFHRLKLMHDNELGLRPVTFTV
jgi:hypothetical protein